MVMSSVDVATRSEIVALAEPLRRIVASYAFDRGVVDDVVQETLTRVLDSRARVSSESALSYAVVTAHNLMRSDGRRKATAERNAPRVVDMSTPEQPDDVVVRAEEAAALRSALGVLPVGERETLLAHEVHGVDTATLARSNASTPGAVAARLARARARLRVEYVMALRRVEPPTRECRPVLMSLSAGDRRRQERLGAGAHLLRCATCGPLSEPLLARRRGLAGLLPAPVAAWLGGAAGGPSWRQQFTGVAAAAVAAVLALGVWAWVWVQSGDGNDERPGQITSAAEGNRPAVGTSSAGPLVFGPAVAPVAPPRLIEAARTDRPVRVRPEFGHVDGLSVSPAV